MLHILQTKNLRFDYACPDFKFIKDEIHAQAICYESCPVNVLWYEEFFSDQIRSYRVFWAIHDELKEINNHNA